MLVITSYHPWVRLIYGYSYCYIISQWERLKDPVVWMDAAGQIFYSLGVGFGSLTLFSSGNPRKNNCYMDAIMVALGNCATSLWASIIMFSFFGFKANYKVKQCELDRMAALAVNSSISNTTKAISCSRREIFDQVSVFMYVPRSTSNVENQFAQCFIFAPPQDGQLRFPSNRRPKKAPWLRLR